MLGLLAPPGSGATPWANNTWRLWVDYIMQQKEKLGFRKAALLMTQDGCVASATSGFRISTKEARRLQKAIAGELEDDKIKIHDKTFVLKSRTANQVVAFNGHKYYIVSRSKTMLIVALCETRGKVEAASHWLNKLCGHLVNKEF